MHMTASSETLYNEHASEVGRREQLIMDHLPQVRWIATRIHERLPPTFALEDLISTGILGLISAIDTFDPLKGAQLKTFAEYKIRGAILDSIRGLDGIPPNRRKDVKQVETAILALEQRLGRAPAEEEIADELKIPLHVYHNWLQELRAVRIGSLSAPIDGDGGARILDFVADSSENDPSLQIEREELEALVARGLNGLPRMERLVVTLYYMEEQNMREIALILNVHMSRVWQLKSQGVLRLRAFITSKWPAGKRGFK